ncbi:MAG TPA: Fe-S-containing protein [Thermoanaerobaculia bacterium]|nr:Fe-S-containing protein [Thermoanaerobaculia bacterium]
MTRLRPRHGILIVAFFMGAVVLAEWALDPGRHRGDVQQVKPGRDGFVRVDLAGLTPGKVRFFDFLNTNNQEVRFLVVRDRRGELQVAFDAAENDFKRKLGFRQEGDWLVNNKCGTAVRLAEVNAGTSGCRPAPLRHRLDGHTLVLQEADVLSGWRFFH